MRLARAAAGDDAVLALAMTAGASLRHLDLNSATGIFCFVCFVCVVCCVCLCVCVCVCLFKTGSNHIKSNQIKCHPPPPPPLLRSLSRLPRPRQGAVTDATAAALVQFCGQGIEEVDLSFCRKVRCLSVFVCVCVFCVCVCVCVCVSVCVCSSAVRGSRRWTCPSAASKRGR